MKQFLLTATLFALPAFTLTTNEVCVIIDQHDTGHEKYPNIAAESDNPSNFFNVYDHQKACFDVNKIYYMQYFLWETGSTVMYGTRCRYEPKAEHHGKILRYDGESGGTLCPIVDEIHID